jgi:ATP-dependent Clp protease protease subunit
MTTLFAVYDTIQYVKPDVSTIVMGQAASAAAVLALSGAKGKRFALPHARILLHQPHGGVEGQAVDIEIQANEIVRSRALMHEIIAQHTGQPLEKVAKDTDRDYILTADQAKEYGILDEVITSRRFAAKKVMPSEAINSLGLAGREGRTVVRPEHEPPAIMRSVA